MSFEENIIAKYAPVFGGRLYWDTTPREWGPGNMQVPFCIVSQVGGQYRKYVDNTEHEFLNADLQFFAWGNNRVAVSNAVRDLSKAIIESGTTTWITMTSGAPSGDYNEVLKLRGQRQDFGFWFLNPLYVP